MSSETRVVRPYLAVDRFQAALDGLSLEIGSEIAFPGERMTLSSAAFLGEPMTLRLGDLEVFKKDLAAAAESAEVALDNTELLVIARTPYLRMSDFVAQVPVPELNSAEIVLRKADVRALRTPQGGCDVECAVVLRGEQDPRPLRPHLKGTWLGRVVFALRTDLGELGFTPRPLTDEIRDQYQLPEGALRFVALEGDLNDATGLDDMVQLYLEPSILAELNQGASSPAGKTLQQQLFLDVVGAIVRNFGKSTAADLDFEELNPVLQGVVKFVAGRPQQGESESRRRTRLLWALAILKDQPETFMSHVEAGTAIVQDLTKVLRGAD